MNDLPPAAWYPDPERQGQQRYWDGSRWTEHRAPIASAWQGDEAAAPVPRERAAKSRRRKSKTPELGQVRVEMLVVGGGAERKLNKLAGEGWTVTSAAASPAHHGMITYTLSYTGLNPQSPADGG